MAVSETRSSHFISYPIQSHPIFHPSPRQPHTSHINPRIHRPNPRTLRLPFKHKLTHQLPRRARILDPPARVPSRHHHPFNPRPADDGATAAAHRGEVARLSCCDVACAQPAADGGEVVDDVLAAGCVALYEVGGGGEGNDVVGFSCGEGVSRESVV